MDIIPLPIQAALWGCAAGSALLFGAAIGYFMRLPKVVGASVMAFGIGVLISMLAFNLMEEAFEEAGVVTAIAGFILGGAIYALANAVLAYAGARERKRSHHAAVGASLAIAVGSLLDGIPESAAIGISLLDGEGVAFVTMLAIFISNIPEGLSSSMGMKAAGKSATYIFSIWGAITLVCGVSAFLAYSVLGSLGPHFIGGAIACAAGAVFVMLIDTMIPEAFEQIHNWSGPIAAAGFLSAFALSHIF